MKDWLPPATPSVSGRGNGSAAGSVAGVGAWFPSQTPPSASSRAWFPAATPVRSGGSVPGSSSDRRVATVRKTVSSGPQRRSAGSTVASEHTRSGVKRKADDNSVWEVGSDDHVWTCRICQSVLRHPSLSELSERRAWHVRNRHPGQGMQAGYLRHEARIVVPRADCLTTSVLGAVPIVMLGCLPWIVGPWLSVWMLT